MVSTRDEKPDLEAGSHIVALAIHGGAGGTITPDLPPDLIEAYRQRLRSVLSTTYEHGYHSALDAVCGAVTQLEDSPLFNAGKGAVFDIAGRTVCESSVMESGSATRYAAVTGVRRTKNPILLAKTLYKHNSHVGKHGFYSGRPAEEFGWKMGTKKVSKKYYWTKRRWNEHNKGIETLDKEMLDSVERIKAGDGADDDDDEEGGLQLPVYSIETAQQPSSMEQDHPDQAVFDKYAHLTDFLPQGTVGAVALDSKGRLAVATSTGGKTNKYPGRIGDTPSVGSGFWAETWSTSNNSIHRHSPARSASQGSSSWISRLLSFFKVKAKAHHGKRSSDGDDAAPIRGIAISGTGDGDFFLRANFASQVCHRIKYANQSTSQAVDGSLAELVSLFAQEKGVGGAIVIDHSGKVYFPLAAATMNRGYISAATDYKPKIAIYDDEKLS